MQPAGHQHWWVLSSLTLDASTPGWTHETIGSNPENFVLFVIKKRKSWRTKLWTKWMHKNEHSAATRKWWYHGMHFYIIYLYWTKFRKIYHSHSRIVVNKEKDDVYSEEQTHIAMMIWWRRYFALIQLQIKNLMWLFTTFYFIKQFFFCHLVAKRSCLESQTSTWERRVHDFLYYFYDSYSRTPDINIVYAERILAFYIKYKESFH